MGTFKHAFALLFVGALAFQSFSVDQAHARERQIKKGELDFLKSKFPDQWSDNEKAAFDRLVANSSDQANRCISKSKDVASDNFDVKQCAQCVEAACGKIGVVLSREATKRNQQACASAKKGKQRYGTMCQTDFNPGGPNHLKPSNMAADAPELRKCLREKLADCNDPFQKQNIEKTRAKIDKNENVLMQLAQQRTPLKCGNGPQAKKRFYGNEIYPMRGGFVLINEDPQLSRIAKFDSKDRVWIMCLPLADEESRANGPSEIVVMDTNDVKSMIRKADFISRHPTCVAVAPSSEWKFPAGKNGKEYAASAYFNDDGTAQFEPFLDNEGAKETRITFNIDAQSNVSGTVENKSLGCSESYSTGGGSSGAKPGGHAKEDVSR